MNTRRRNHFRSVSRRRYERRPFRNPYFAKSVQGIPWKIVAPIIVGVLLLSASVGFFFRAERFAITDITITGTASISSQDIENIVRTYLDERTLLFFQRENRFLFDEEVLQERLRNSYVFEQLELLQKGKGISITVQEKATPFLWETANTLLLLAEDGSVVRSLTEEETTRLQNAWNGREVLIIDPATTGGIESPPPDPFAALPHLVDAEAKPLRPGDSALSQETSKNIRAFLERLNALGIMFVEMRIDKEVGSWIEGETMEGFSILFDPALDIQVQANNLETLLSQTISDRTRLEYVDVRFGERVYYKLLP